MLVFSYVCALVCFVQSGNIGTELHPGKEIQGFLSPGATQTYQLTLSAGSVAEIVLQQGGADLTAVIVSPIGDRLTVDERENGPEPILIDVRAQGLYRLQVRATRNSPKGIPYGLTVGEFRPKTKDDDLRLEVQRLSTEAKQLSSGKASTLHEAVELCSKALELQRRLGDRKAEAALLLQSGAYLLQLSELETAKAQLTQALALAQSESEHWSEAAALNNLGLLHWSHGEFSEAVLDLQRAMEIWRDLKYEYGQAVALNNLGLKYRAMGAYQQAAKNYRQSLSIVMALDDREHEAYARNNLGVVQLALSENSQALASFQRAAALYHAVGHTRGEARAKIYMARIYAAEGRTLQARHFLDKALPLAESSADYRSVGDGWILLGELLVADGEKALALQDYEKALSVYEKIANPAGKASALHHLGVLRKQMGEVNAALDYLNQALSIRQTLGVRDEEAETLFQLAQAERDKGELGKAQAHIDTALDRIESVRALVAGPQFRMKYLASKNQYYSFACDLYRQLDHENPRAGFAQRGFEVMERGRARGLLDLIGEAQAGFGKGLGPDLFERKQRLHRELNVLSGDVADLASKNEVQKLNAAKQKLDAALSRYYELESEIRDSDPRYGQLAPQPAGVAEVQKALLDAGTVLLEYQLSEHRSSLWVLTHDSARIFVLPGRKTIESAASLFFQALKGANQFSHAGAGEAPDAAALALSRMLLPSDSFALQGNRILIVGDGVLQRVPFGALPDRSKGRLIENHEIVFLPSASVLVAKRSQAAQGLLGKMIAVIADPVFDAGDARVRRPAPEVRPAFARLPYSRREAETILSLVPAENALRALDFSAARSLFISGQLAKYRMIHIATHAVIDPVRPELSQLVFSLVDRNGSSLDGRLRLHEIASLRLSARLVTLSACGTALGKEVRGEGTVGIARGFILSGAQTVIVSLWDVEDDSTAELMKNFYQAMLGPRRLRPAAALREAQKAMLNSKQWSPYQWSGWVIIGDWR